MNIKDILREVLNKDVHDNDKYLKV